MACQAKVERGGAILPLPAVHDELPEELRLTLPDVTDPALTTDRTSPVPLAPSTSSSRRLWADPSEPHAIILTTEFGRSQRATSRRARTEEDHAVDADWEAFQAPPSVPMTVIGPMRASERGFAWTRQSMPVDEVLWLVPASLQSAFQAELDSYYPGGAVPGPVLERLDEERIDTWKADRPPEDFVRFGLGNALERDGMFLGRNQRAMCGAITLERRVLTPDRRVVRELRAMLCRSHRCPHCGPILAARWKAQLRAQLARDRTEGRDHHVHLTLTLPRRRYQNGAVASKLALSGDKGPWRRFLERLRRRFSVMAYLRVIEFHDDGWPHAHVIFRSEALVEAMLAEAGVGTVEQLRARLLDYEAETLARHAEGKCARRHPYASLRRELEDLAHAAGWGRAGFDADLVREPAAIAAELCKTDQLHPDMARGVRRFQASGKAGDGKSTSFFHDQDREPWPTATVPNASRELELPPGREAVGVVQLDVPEDAPKLVVGADAEPGPGHLRVRIESVDTDECIAGSRLVLGLRVLEPEVFAHTKLRNTIPYAHRESYDALLQNALSLTRLDPRHSLEGGWLLGAEGWVDYLPAVEPDADTADPRHWPTISWCPPPASPGTMAQALRSEIPVDHMDATATPSRVEGTLISSAIHLAPLNKVVAAYAEKRPDIRFCGARAQAVLDDDGALVRQLVACQEAMRERVGVEALADLVHQLRAIQAHGPPDVLEVNDVKAIIARVQTLMTNLITKTA